MTYGNTTLSEDTARLSALKMDPVLDEFLNIHVPILQRDSDIQKAHLYAVYAGFHEHRDHEEKHDPVDFDTFERQLAKALREDGHSRPPPSSPRI